MLHEVYQITMTVNVPDKLKYESLAEDLLRISL